MRSKQFLSVAMVVAAATTSGLAQARDVQVHWGVTLGSPVLGIPLPPPPPLPFVVVRPRPEVVVVPAPVVHYWPVPTPVHRGWRDSDRDGIPNRYDRVDNRWHAPHWDRDGDGIPNRHDRYDNRYDRYDNRYDKYDRHDRHDHRHDHRRDGWNGR